MGRYLIPWQREKARIYNTDILILGSGIAGLYTALKASEYWEVTVLTKKEISLSNTFFAQGGIAAALHEEDSPALHYEDTLYAGAGLCEPKAVGALVEDGPRQVEELLHLGTKFDSRNGRLAFTQEGAHSRRRVLHANGDATGEEIERTLIKETLANKKIAVKEHHFALDLLTNKKGEVVGALCLNQQDELVIYLAKAVVVATGGIGQLYRYTTNPEVATGDGIAAAYRAGAQLMDMEFIQFHPTALAIPGAPTFLISEAVRGEGAHLYNAQGERFMQDVPGRELAPRDVVARAIWREMAKGEVTLDFFPIGRARIKDRFPTILQTCLRYGVNVLEERLPVAPAAHYMMGGIRTDEMGRTSLPYLYACGECACNGVHGANRLASNSLLDGLVFGARIVKDILAKEKHSPRETPQLRDLDLPVKELDLSDGDLDLLDRASENKGRFNISTPTLAREQLQNLMWEDVGIIRDEEFLQEALEQLQEWDSSFQVNEQRGSEERNRELRSSLELKNLLTVGICVTQGALARRESRGGHYRRDYPESIEQGLYHSLQRKGTNYVGTIPISRID